MSQDVLLDYLARLERAAAVLPPDRREELLAEIAEHIAASGATREADVRDLLDRLGEPAVIVAAAREDLADWGDPLREELPGQHPGAPAWGPPGAGTVAPRGTGHEVGAVLMLTAGSLLPVVGWLVGVVLLWTSSLWRTREKVLGTLVVPLGPGGVFVAGAFLPFFGGGERCTSTATVTPVTPVASTSAPVPVPPPAAGPAAPDEAAALGGDVVCSSTGLPDWAGVPLVLLLLVAPLVVAAVLLRTARRRAAAQPVAVPAHTPVTSLWGGLELAAVLALGLGGMLVPLAGPLVGLGLAWASARWTRGEKLAASGLAVLPLLLMVASPVLPFPLAFGTLGGYLLVLVGWAAAALLLVAALQRRGRTP